MIAAKCILKDTCYFRIVSFIKCWFKGRVKSAIWKMSDIWFKPIKYFLPCLLSFIKCLIFISEFLWNKLVTLIFLLKVIKLYMALISRFINNWLTWSLTKYLFFSFWLVSSTHYFGILVAIIWLLIWNV